VNIVQNENRSQNKLILVTGGARSGKSRFAEQYASELEYRVQYASELGNRCGRCGPISSEESDQGAEQDEIVYIATSQIYDEEMKRRVALHRDQRPSDWRTIEEPYGLEAALQRLAEENVSVVLIDCVTLWISNLLLQLDESGTERWMEPERSEHIFQRITNLAALLKESPFSTILVTNEVGDSLVPEYPLGRVFRDLSGQANQALAAKADEVFLVVCGIPMNLRELAWRQGRREQ
jgi:adenosylcobinamide kinase/adenosylcobinamide-phosphate guanylyltransferase